MTFCSRTNPPSLHPTSQIIELISALTPFPLRLRQVSQGPWIHMQMCIQRAASEEASARPWLSVHSGASAGKRILTAQRKHAASLRITDTSLSLSLCVCVFAGRCCCFISPRAQRRLRLTHSSWLPELATDKITNCQPAKMCEEMHTVPLRIYGRGSLKCCCRLCNCLAFVD